MAKSKEKQTEELTVIENKEVTELIEKSGIEKTKAEAHASAFHPSLVQLSELSRPLADLDKENPTPEHAKIARETRLKLVKVRTGAETIKDERKAILLLESNFIQANFNLVKAACILTEGEYEEIEKHQERQEAKRKAELKDARIALLAPYEVDYEFMPLDIWDEETFQARLAKEKESFEAVKAAREKEEIDRIAAEKLAEEQRLAELEEEKKRQAERDSELAELKRLEEERIKQEQIRIQKEKENAESLVKILLSNGFKLGNNDSYIEPEYHTYSKGNYVVKYHELFLMKEDALLISIKNVNTWIEQEEVREAELKAAKEESNRVKKELEAKQLEEEKERQRIIAEQEEKEARAKALLKAPDQEKVKVFFEQFKQLQFPELSSEPGKEMTREVVEALDVVKKLIIHHSKNLV